MMVHAPTNSQGVKLWCMLLPTAKGLNKSAKPMCFYVFTIYFRSIHVQYKEARLHVASTWLLKYAIVFTKALHHTGLEACTVCTSVVVNDKGWKIKSSTLDYFAV